MMLTLPAGVVPVLRRAAPGEPLTTLRVTGYRFDLLDAQERSLGELRGVLPGGSVSWVSNAAIKGSGSITVQDRGQAVDWLNARIRPVALIDGWPEVPLGIWLPAAPVEQWSDTGRSWDVELTDKAAILDQDVFADEVSGARAFSAAAGDNVIEVIRGLIGGTGESTSGLEVATDQLSSPMTWDVGTTRLKIINDLLDAAGFFSLFVDAGGVFRAIRYVPPASRAVLYEALGPFTAGPTSLMDPGFTRDADVYAVPNRFVVVGQGDTDAPALVSTAVNTDPTSPFSFDSRGRWITSVETGIEATDQAALDVYAQRRLIAATSVASSFDLIHMHLPGLAVNSVLRLVSTRADIDLLCTVSKTDVTFDALARCQTTMQEVLDV